MRGCSQLRVALEGVCDWLMGSRSSRADASVREML